MFFGINDILIIFFIAFCMLILKKFWYSKILFGKYLIHNNTNPSFLFLSLESLMKTIVVYILTMNMYYLLPSFFFSFVLLTILLVIIHEYSNNILTKGNTKTFFINSSLSIFSLMLAFVISLISKQ